jgi:hypothetical protein
MILGKNLVSLPSPGNDRPAETEAMEAIQGCKGAGIRVAMITG